MLPPTSGLAEPSAGSAAHCHTPAASSRRQWLAGNQRRSMRALRTLEPFGIVHGGVTHGESLAIGEARHHGFEGREIRRGLAVGAGDHRAARYAGRAEDVARVRDIDAAHGDIEVARLLIGHGVNDGVAELEVGRGRDLVQVADLELGGDGFAAALELQVDRAADGVVGHLLQRLELRDELAVHAHQDVAGLQRSVGGPAGQHLVDDQHAGERGECLARGLLGLLGEPEAAQLVVRRVVEHDLQRPARHRLAGLDEIERALHASER